MLVVLRLFEGSAHSHKFWLRDHQVARIGSTEWADFSVHDDRHMSGVHFLISVAEDGCIIRDLNSRNGTLVNGETVEQRHRLQNGDLIMAGKTLFSVEVDGQTPRWQAGMPPRLPSAIERRITESTFQPELPELVYTRHSLESGLAVFHSVCPDAKPQKVAQALAEKRRGLFVVNMTAFTKASLPVSLERVTMINDNVGLIEATGQADIDEMIRTTWGKDATVFIATKAEASVVATQLRNVVSAFSHPSILRSQLVAAPNIYVATLLNSLDAVVVEQQDGSGWELYSQCGSEDNWQQLGLPSPPMQAAVV